MTNQERLSKDIHEHSAEWVYNRLYEIMNIIGMSYNDSRLGVINWLQEEEDRYCSYGERKDG